MSRATNLFAVVGVLLMIGSLAGPAAAQEDTNDTALDVSIDQGDDGNVTIVVTDNETAVKNATVTVNTVANNTTYVGDGTYMTDDNGTVALPAPEETINVTVTVEYDGDTAEATATLASADEMDAADAFGQAVSAYVHMLKGDDAASIGPEVAEFVLEHNPGNAPDHAGPPAWVTDDERTPPGQDGDRERGPPAHANGGPSDDGEDDEDELESDADGTEDDDTEEGDD